MLQNVPISPHRNRSDFVSLPSSISSVPSPNAITPIPATPPLQILAEDIGANVTISTTTKKRSPNPPPQYPELFAIEKSMFLKNRNFTFIQKIIISVVTLICFSFALQRFVSLSRLLFCSLYACETTDYFKYTSLEWNC